MTLQLTIWDLLIRASVLWFWSSQTLSLKPHAVRTGIAHQQPIIRTSSMVSLATRRVCAVAAAAALACSSSGARADQYWRPRYMQGHGLRCPQDERFWQYCDGFTRKCMWIPGAMQQPAASRQRAALDCMLAGLLDFGHTAADDGPPAAPFSVTGQTRCACHWSYAEHAGRTDMHAARYADDNSLCVVHAARSTSSSRCRARRS